MPKEEEERLQAIARELESVVFKDEERSSECGTAPFYEPRFSPVRESVEANEAERERGVEKSEEKRGEECLESSANAQV